MRAHRAATIITLALAVGACADPPAEVGEFCSPAASNCAAELVCCSVDPAALDYTDLAATVLPAYPGSDVVGGVPLFSDLNNDLSQRGVCIAPGSVPLHGTLPNASDCPVPCNPSWSTQDIAAVCGPGTICCQHIEIEEEDCVLDPDVGDEGCWRPATGADIGALSSWSSTEHASHQDPGLRADGACASLIAGLPPELDADAVRAACERRLTVGNQHGFCLGGAGVNVCPYAQPSYRDACERMNDAQDRSGCEAVEFP
jgi:hypothetical protein